MPPGPNLAPGRAVVAYVQVSDSNNYDSPYIPAVGAEKKFMSINHARTVSNGAPRNAMSNFSSSPNGSTGSSFKSFKQNT